MTTKPRFSASPDVDTCVEFLRQHRDKGLITYAAIATATGRDVSGADRYILQSARRRLEREGTVFVVETGKGIRRATDTQIASLSTDIPIAKTKRITRIAKKRQRSVNVQNLTSEQREAFYVGRAVLGAIEQATRKALRNQIVMAANTVDGPIPIKQTMGLFKKMRTYGKAAEY